MTAKEPKLKKAVVKPSQTIVFEGLKITNPNKVTHYVQIFEREEPIVINYKYVKALKKFGKSAKAEEVI